MSAELILLLLAWLVFFVCAILIADALATAYRDLWLMLEAAFRFAFDRRLVDYRIVGVKTVRLL